MVRQVIFLFLVLCVSISMHGQTPQDVNSIPYANSSFSRDLAGSIWSGPSYRCSNSIEENFNLWYSFVPTGTYVSLNLNKVNNKYVEISLWEGDVNGNLNSEPFACVASGWSNGVILKTDELDISGNTVYYIRLTSNSQTNLNFDMGIDYEFDHPEGAVEVPHLLNWSSDVNEYSNFGAGVATASNTCNSSGLNRWFKFRATSSVINFSLTSEQNMFPRISLLEKVNNDWVVLKCPTNGGGGSVTVSLQSSELTEGQEYFIAVIAGGNFRSNFTISLSGGANILWTLNESTIHAANPAFSLALGENTSVPEGYVLSVKGKAIMEGVKVQLSEDWNYPDFVFDKDFELRSLAEVESYISKNKHLPEIPTEAETHSNGMDLGRMNAKLLQKIEELTLYMIDMNKQMQQLKSENQVIKEKINHLENN